MTFWLVVSLIWFLYRRHSYKPKPPLDTSTTTLDITKLSADEFRVHELNPPPEWEQDTDTKLVGNGLQGDRYAGHKIGYSLNLTPAFVKKLLAMKVGDTIAWGRATSLGLTKLRPNEFLDSEERKCKLEGALLWAEGSIFPTYLGLETIGRLEQMGVGDTVTLRPVEGSERYIDCPLCGSPLCGATAKEWRML